MFSPFFKALSPAKKIAFLAVFLALSVVANSLIDVDLSPNNKLTFTYTVCFIAAYVMGGVPAFFIAFAGDGLGFLIKPSGIYWLFGITLGLYALLAGCLMHYLPPKGKAGPFLYVKAVITIIICYLAFTLCLNTVVNYYYVKFILYHGEWNKAFWVYLGGRIGIQSAVYFINAAICIVLLPVVYRLVRMGEKGRKDIDEMS